MFKALDLQGGNDHQHATDRGRAADTRAGSKLDDFDGRLGCWRWPDGFQDERRGGFPLRG